MARVTKVIQLPAPVEVVPPVERWGVAQLTFNPIMQTASALLVAVTADGTQVAGGATRSFGVSGAGYEALFDEELAAELVGKIALAGQASLPPLFAPGTTVEDATEAV